MNCDYVIEILIILLIVQFIIIARLQNCRTRPLPCTPRSFRKILVGIHVRIKFENRGLNFIPTQSSCLQMEYDLCETGKGNPMFLKLLQNLQKAFSIVKTNLKIWDEAITSSRSHLDSVHNLSEQHHCCKHAEGLNDITKKFPDVKAKLLYKIDTEINSHMTHLYAAVYASLNIFSSGGK